MLFLSKLKNQEVNSPLIFIHVLYLFIPFHVTVIRKQIVCIYFHTVNKEPGSSNS